MRSRCTGIGASGQFSTVSGYALPNFVTFVGGESKYRIWVSNSEGPQNRDESRGPLSVSCPLITNPKGILGYLGTVVQSNI